MFTPHLQDVTATAIIKGLAVTKYDHGAKRWDVDFLRNCGHHPLLTIREVNKKTGELSVIDTRKIEERDRITITVTSSAEAVPRMFVTGEAFEGNSTPHPQDFRWMLDIQALHNGQAERKPRIPTNTLTITDGCFYTSVRSKRPHFKRWIDQDGSPGAPRRMKITGAMVGADFKGKEVTIRITGASSFSKTLSDNPETRYEIIFNNTCVEAEMPAPQETDFHLYYRLFDGEKGRVDILPPDYDSNVGVGGGGSVLSSGEEPANPEDEEDNQTNDPETDPKEPLCQVIDEGSSGNSGN